MHVLDTDTSINLNREQRRAQKLQAERLVKNIHPVARPIAAAVIVGHGTQTSYTRRLAARFAEALAQLPETGTCWVAFHWSNGAPVSMVRRALATIDVPENLDGIMLTGTVGIPGSLDNYFMMLPRPFDTEESREQEWHSTVSVDHAKLVLQRVDESGGVRPTLIRVPYRDRWFDFLSRAGDARIFPFNVLLAPDPPDLLPARDL